MKDRDVLFAVVALLIGACTSPSRDPAASKYAADDALLEKTHDELQHVLDSATAHFEVYAARVKNAKPDDPNPRELERTSIWLGDLEAIVASDERFMAERSAAINGDGTPEEQKALLDHYDELMQGHASMVAEFHHIADKLESRMAGY